MSIHQARAFVFLLRPGGDSQALTVWRDADISGDVWFVSTLLLCRSHDPPPRGHMTRAEKADALKVAGQVGHWSDQSHVMTARQLRDNQPVRCIFRFGQFPREDCGILSQRVYNRHIRHNSKFIGTIFKQSSFISVERPKPPRPDA